MRLRARAIRGILWSGSSNLVTTLLNFAITVMLARLLSPKDFGIIGMIMIVSGFVSMIADLGLGTAVIQQQTFSHRQMSTFFFLNMFLGVAFGVLVLLGASSIASFFRDPSLSMLLRLSSMLYVITGISTTFRILLQKEMRFDLLARVEILGIMTYGLVSILFAWMGLGVLSLLIGLI
ncbi:MAG TPA: oligosaccharide flippase family protein, partial [Bacteroidota bacterium]|nr:oligosaccharide flippase family protein [Bacteroidota bacterium]